MTISYTDETTTALSCSSGGSLVRDVLTWSTYSGSSYTSSSAPYSIVWAQRLQVVLATASAGDVTFSQLSEPTSTDGFDGVPNPPTTQKERKTGLSTGAIVGIVVGVVGALLLVGAFVFWRRRQRKHHHTPIPKASPVGEHDALPEFVGGNGRNTAPAQMTTATSDGLFQPQPELRSPR
jgi:cell wall integrity and stress response component